MTEDQVSWIREYWNAKESLEYHVEQGNAVDSKKQLDRCRAAIVRIIDLKTTLLGHIPTLDQMDIVLEGQAKAQRILGKAPTLEQITRLAEKLLEGEIDAH